MAFQWFRVFFLGLTAAGALFLVSAGDARAFSLFGWTLFEDGSEADAAAVIADPRPYTVSVTVTGAEWLDAAVRNASALHEGRDAPASGAAGLLATARSDYRRIQSALYDEGYYGGTISIVVDGVEAADRPPDSTLGNPVQVAIRVETGPQFHFGRAEIVNKAPETGVSDLSAATPVGIGFSPGAVARAGAVRQAALMAVLGWQQQGYPKAEISKRDVVANHKTNTLDAVLTVSPGPSAVIGAVFVEGAADVDAGFIVRHTGLVPGKLYDPADLARAREQLAELDVFSSIKIEEAEAVGADGTLPLTILVQERKARRIGAGASFSTTDGLGLETFFVHRNLFGEAERLKLTVKLAGIGYPIETSAFDYYFGGTFTKPGVITPDTDLMAELIGQRAVLPRYTETSLNGKLGLSHQFSEEIAGTAGIAAALSSFNDDLYGTRNFSVLGAYGTLTYDTRDDATDATRGVFAQVGAEPFYEAQFGNAGLLLNGEARSYLSLAADDRLVLAGRLKAGFLFGPPVADTPPDKLFFAGGGGSVRGYPYRSIGVSAPGGAVTGGTLLAEASVEARFRVAADVGLVGFVDAGYVAADGFVGLDEGTRIGVGAGLRYYTGFGPLRLDFAVPLNQRPGDPDWALYAGIGQAF